MEFGVVYQFIIKARLLAPLVRLAESALTRGISPIAKDLTLIETQCIRIALPGI